METEARPLPRDDPAPAPRFLHVVVGGGGLRCVAALGFLRAALPPRRDVRRYVGTSGGALVALAAALELDDEFSLRAIARAVAPRPVAGPAALLARLAARTGLEDAQAGRIGALVAEMLAEARATAAARRGWGCAAGGAPADPSFAQLAQMTGTSVAVVAVDAETMRTRVFSLEDSPDVSVTAAICASCSIPFLFSPVRIEGRLYIDGGVRPGGAALALRDSPWLSAPAPDTLSVDCWPCDSGGAGGGAAPEAASRKPRPFGVVSLAQNLLALLMASPATHPPAGRCRVARMPLEDGVSAAPTSAFQVVRKNLSAMLSGTDAAAVRATYMIGLFAGANFRLELEAGGGGGGGGSGGRAPDTPAKGSVAQ